MANANVSNVAHWRRPHNDSQLVQCGHGVKYCITGERHAFGRHAKYPQGILPPDAGFDEMENLTFSQCYEESPYLAYIFNNAQLPECERQLQQAVLDDYFVTFQCLPMVDYVHYADPADDEYGPELDLEEPLKPKRFLLDYVLAYATLPFLLLHVSLNVCLHAASRADAWFREGFFVTFIALSAVDAVVIVHNNLFAYFPPLYRLIETSTHFDEDATDLSLLASDFSVYVSRFCYLYQALAHAVLAANRFHAVRSPHDYREKWRGISLKLIIAVSFGIPILLISFVMALSYGRLLTYDAAYMLLGIYQASLLIVGALVGLCFLLAVLISTRAWSFRLGSNEANLSVYCAVMLLIQLLLGFWSGLELSLISDQPPLIWASLGAYAYISTNYQPFWFRLTLTLVTALYCLGGSVLLLILSSHARQAALMFYRTKRFRSVDTAASVQPASGYSAV